MTAQIFWVVITTITAQVVLGDRLANFGILKPTQEQQEKKQSAGYCSCDESLVNRAGFPDGFIFGSGSSAYQVEGAYNESGKGPSVWDTFTHRHPEKITDRSTGDVATDSYHQYKEDVRILKETGLDGYRLSISWSRILPGGTLKKGVNPDGIRYYNDLINGLLASGIEPFVTLLHVDSPQPLEDAYGGFLSSRIVSDFVDLAEVAFREFGDRVKYWITINQPWVVSEVGYSTGNFPPARCSDWMKNGCIAGDSTREPYIVTHNQLLAHAAAVDLYRKKFQKSQKGKIGMTVNTIWFEPYDYTDEHLKARDRAFDFMFGWIMEPITFGRYPNEMRLRAGSRLPEFTKDEAELLKGSYDFLGLNYYGGAYAKNNPPTSSSIDFQVDSEVLVTESRNGVPIGERGSELGKYYTYPIGLRRLVLYTKQKYNDPLIYVTENGIDELRDDSIPISEALQDVKRKNFVYQHICCLRGAIEQDDARVKGYFVWSLIDNFQWENGYRLRFGIYYVDFNDKMLKRYPKYSALWLRNITQTRNLKPRISDH